MAIGYGLANAIILEGENSCVLIDTMEGHEAAQEALDAIKKVIKDKPIVAIILTHFHADHTGKYNECSKHFFFDRIKGIYRVIFKY